MCGNFIIGFLEYLEFILYGLIQGLTEFIPVSSSAHLKVISLFLGIEDPGSSISAIIQLGSVFAIIWYFRSDLLLSSNSTYRKNLDNFLFKKLFNSILLGTIPIVILGGFIKLFIPYFFEKILRSNTLIAIISLVMAFIMYLADTSNFKSINIKNHKYSNSFFIGLSQALAILPGVSRSGITISTALLLGWETKDAARFSFLLGIPAITLAGIIELISFLTKFQSFNFFPLLVGIITTFLSSLLAIDFLLNYLPSNGLRIFIYYRVIFGIIILINL